MILLVAATEGELCSHDGLACGVGPVEAAASTARALALRPFDAVLHVGLAGGREVVLGTLVAGAEAVYCDLSARWPVVDVAAPDLRLVKAILGAIPGAITLPVHTSAAVGGARDTVSQGPLVEAMEGFGVLRAASLAGVPAVEARVISNELGEEDRARWNLGGALQALDRAIPAMLDAVTHTLARPG